MANFWYFVYFSLGAGTIARIGSADPSLIYHSFFQAEAIYSSNDMLTFPDNMASAENAGCMVSTRPQVIMPKLTSRGLLFYKKLTQDQTEEGSLHADRGISCA